MAEMRLQGGRYQLLRVHRTGGLGDIWLAFDHRLQQNVAIKALHRSSADVLIRFEREALATAALQHPNIVRVLDYFVEADAPYLVMELLAGTSLSELVHAVGPLDAKRAALLMRDVSSALAFAHARGVVHRDIKPANIQVVPSQSGEIAKILDFGIAKYERKTSITRDGALLGTPAFMAPEQTTGAVADARSDVFATGLTLHFALAARLPYPGNTPEEIQAQVMAGIREPLWRMRPDLDAGLHQIVDRATRQDPRERFASAAELSDALSAWISDQDAAPASIAGSPVMFPSAAPPSLPPAPGPSGRGAAIAAGLLVGAGILTLLGVTAAAGVWLHFDDGFAAPASEPAVPLPSGTSQPVEDEPPSLADDSAPTTTSTQRSPRTTSPADAAPVVVPPAEIPSATPDASSPEPTIIDASAPDAQQSKVGAKLCQWNPHCLPAAVCCRPPVWGCPAQYRNRCAPCELAPGHQMCGGVCTNTAADTKHCGSCGTACAAGGSCVSGKCQPPPT